jgi:hypothetical protein
MAGIYVTRGDLDGAMKLYQQSLETFERLGDLRGKWPRCTQWLTCSPAATWTGR